MKKLVIWFGACIFLIMPATAMSSFIIELNSGTRFITDRYWLEDGFVKFNLYGGIATFDMDKIRRIKQSDLKYEFTGETPTASESVTGDDKMGSKQQEGPEAPAKAVDEGEDGSRQDAPPPPPSDEDVLKDVLLQEKAEIETAFEKAVNAFQAAKESRNNEEMAKAKRELTALRVKKTQLRNKAQKLYEGRLPDWWEEPPPEKQKGTP